MIMSGHGLEEYNMKIIMISKYLRRAAMKITIVIAGMLIKEDEEKIKWSIIIFGGRNNDKLVTKYTKKSSTAH